MDPTAPSRYTRIHKFLARTFSHVNLTEQEGNDAEAARLAVAQNLNVKLIIDDNDVTIAGHPSEYLKGYDIGKTLAGHGLKVVTVNGESKG